MEISVNIENDYVKWLQEIAQDASSTKEDVIHSFTVNYIKDMLYKIIFSIFHKTTTASAN